MQTLKMNQKVKFDLPPKGVDQQQHVDQLQRVAKKTVFLNVFKYFFLISDGNSLKNVKKEEKRLKTAEKKNFTAFGCSQHRKACQNTQQISTIVNQTTYFSMSQTNSTQR